MSVRGAWIVVAALVALIGCKEGETAEVVHGRQAGSDTLACNPKPQQTGAGCDMEGIQAVVKAEISADGGVGRCYRTHAPDRETGRVLLRIVLAPDGAAASVDAAEDSLGNPGLTACLRDLLLNLRYPPPGDIPCTALYPFDFQ